MRNEQAAGSESPRIPGIWPAALVCFVVAGSTGSLLRFGILHGFPAGLQLVNVRHAHSHLMYFGWVTPALMALIVAWLPRLTGRRLSNRFRWAMGGTILFALLAYLSFIQYGYQPAPLGGRRLPISVLMATLNMLAWYGYAVLYFRATRRSVRYRPLRLWDAALIFQILASLGAWGVAILNRLQIDDPFWSLAMTHLFLDLFSEGWFVLALLGLIYAVHPPASERAAHWGEQLIVVGLPVVFLLAMPVNIVPAGLRWIGSLGGLLLAIGLLLTIGTLWPSLSGRWIGWRIPLALLALKVLIGLGMVLPVTAQWAQRNGLRIFYLHLLLLGFVSLGLALAAREVWGRVAAPYYRWFLSAILVLLLTLIPLTGLWPDAWAGRWALQLAAWATLGPILVALAMLLRLARWQSQAAPAMPALEEVRR